MLAIIVTVVLYFKIQQVNYTEIFAQMVTTVQPVLEHRCRVQQEPTCQLPEQCQLVTVPTVRLEGIVDQLVLTTIQVIVRCLTPERH